MDKEQFQHIFNASFDPIRNYIYYRVSDAELAEDIAQDVFVQLWERRTYLDMRNVKTLLYKIASDKIISYYRKQDVRLDFAKGMQCYTEICSPQEELQYEELKKNYAETLEMMPEGQRIVFLMNREESLKYNEIAERLGLSVKAIEKRMSGALQLLKAKLL